MAADTEVRTDPKGALCPACLTPLLVRSDDTRDCPKCDYREGVDARAPLPPEKDQEHTLIRDERVRAARARIGDVLAASETPAQTHARVSATDPLWLKEWAKSDAADVALPHERFLATNRAATEVNSRRGTVRADADIQGAHADVGQAPLGAAQAPHYRATHPAATDFTARAQDLRLTEPELDAIERQSVEARYGVAIDPTGTGRAPLPPRTPAEAEAPKRGTRAAAKAPPSERAPQQPEIPERTARARAEGHIDPDEVPAKPPAPKD